MNVMPLPKSWTIGESKYIITALFSVHVTSMRSERVRVVLDDALTMISERTGLFLKREYDYWMREEDCTFLIEYDTVVDELCVESEEAYHLVVTEGNVFLSALSDLGVLLGVSTMLQLLTIVDGVYCLPTVDIIDSPRFKWRGLLIDVSRHFISIDILKRNIDGMALVKLNVLHLHLCDDQGFRIESKVYPKLHEQGSDSLFYTQDQMIDLIRYADMRGIRIVPEFDVPGHATSWLVGYPELASIKEDYTIERYWGIFDPTIDPTEEDTYIFLDNFFKEMSLLFPDRYIHIGGDENKGVHWDKSESIQLFMKEHGFVSNQDLQNYFNVRIIEILTKYQKKMIGWDEILHPDMPNDIVIQSWRGKESLAETAKKGYHAILSNGFYIDLMQPTDYHYLNDPIDDQYDLTEKDVSFILGGEATMWSEMVTAQTIDSRIWPRTAAIAERLWSLKETRDVDDMYTRLDHVSHLLECIGLTHISFQDPMLRRLCNNQDTKALKELIDFLQPLQGYKRHQNARESGLRFSQYSPYTRMMDAAIADTKSTRNFKKYVQIFLLTGEESMLKLSLTGMSENHEKLIPIIRNSPILLEIEPLSVNLSQMSSLCLEALEFIKQNQNPPNNWKEKTTTLIGESKSPHGQLELSITEELSQILSSIDK